MELIHIEEEQLNECLSLLFRNYLLFESREEFADAISFPALLNNNPISKLPYSKKLEAFLRFQKGNPVEYAGYKTLYGLLSAYSDTSEFYYQHLWGKTFVNGYETAWRMAKAIYYDRKPTGIKKLDAVIDRFYDLDTETFKDTGKDLDPTMMILMLLGVMPISRKRQQGLTPVFQAEWEIVRVFCVRMNSLLSREQNDECLVLKVCAQQIKDGSYTPNRVFCLQAITQVLEYIKSVSRPTDLTSDLELFNVDGIWRDYIKTEVQGENVYYLFEYFGGYSYNLKIIEDYPTMLKYSVLPLFFYNFNESTPVIMVQHPKTGYKHIVEKSLGNSDTVWYKYEMDNENHPGNIWLEHFHGNKNPEMQLHHLIKVNPETEARLLETWNGKEQVNKYEKYHCYFPLNTCIYAVTKTHLYITDPDNELTYYKVPKIADPRLETITTEDEGGILYVGGDKEKWIGFTKIDFYISPQQFDDFGIKKVERID